MTAVGIIQARHTSTRLPGKIVLPLAGIPVLTHIVERAKRIEGIDALCVALPEGPGQEPLVSLAEGLDGLELCFGPEDDVLKRFVLAADQCGADTVIHLWGDCPLIDAPLAGGLLAAFRGAGASFASVPNDSGYPEGVETHIITADALRTADREATDPAEREAFHLFFARQPESFPAIHLHREPNRHALKVLLDTPEDYRCLSAIFDELYPANPFFGIAEIEALAVDRPELFKGKDS